MLAPFSDQPDNLGLPITGTAELWQLARAAGEAGFPLSVHAIGDRAVREVIDVFSEHLTTGAGKRLVLPHRIEHVQLLDYDDLPRLARAGIAASMQPVHLLTDWPTADKVWGERAQLAYAFQSLSDLGTLLAFGSDAPVAPVNPMLGVYAAAMRQDERRQPQGGWYPAERMALTDIIRAYTLGPATVAGKQEMQGSLTPGKWADIIVLEQDLFNIPPAEIRHAQVRNTIVAGKVVYARV
jgi:predicted amidohydrolase YtcJ